LACLPEVETLARTVVPVWRSWTKTSAVPFVSCGTSVEATDWKAT
jgi:hypothetical protein